MYKLFVSYIADFLDKNSKPRAFHNLMSSIQSNSVALSESDAQTLIIRANQFSSDYTNAWPWQRSSIISKAIKHV